MPDPFEVCPRVRSVHIPGISWEIAGRWGGDFDTVAPQEGYQTYMLGARRLGLPGLDMRRA